MKWRILSDLQKKKLGNWDIKFYKGLPQGAKMILKKR